MRNATVPPRTVRDQAEIEPVTREVRIVERGPLQVAVPVEEGPPLTAETVERVRRKLRQHGE